MVEENEGGLQGAERQGSGERTGSGRGMKGGGGGGEEGRKQVLWRNLECGLLLYVNGGYERLESGKESTVTRMILYSPHKRTMQTRDTRKQTHFFYASTLRPRRKTKTKKERKRETKSVQPDGLKTPAIRLE